MSIEYTTRNDRLLVPNVLVKIDLLDLRNGWMKGAHWGGIAAMFRSYKEGNIALARIRSKALRRNLAALRARIEELEAVEAEHGKGCLLDLDNYFVQQIIEAGGLVEEKVNAIRYRSLMAAPSSTDA